MILTPILLALAPAASIEAPADLLAIRAPRVEVGNGETLHHAVILVEDGRIVTIGEDLPIERGIPVLELSEGQVVMPGLVCAYSRIGLSGNGFSDSRPWVKASDELYPASGDYPKVLEAGVTTLGQYPAGNSVPGQAVAVRPKGSSAAEMILADSVYLKIIMGNSRSLKGNISEGFNRADKWLEKEAKNREKWEKDKKKFDDEDDKKKKKELDPGPYVPEEEDEKAQAFLDLRSGELRALISITSSAGYLHLLDAIGEEEFDWDLRIPLSRNTDVFHVKEQIGERGLRIAMEPEISLHPGTLRQRNLPAEFARAGAKLVLLPRAGSTSSLETWRRDTATLIAAGLDYQTALRAMTLEAAAMLGLQDSIGSLEPGKAANMIILDGDPFEAATKVEAVMLDGDFVHGEVNL